MENTRINISDHSTIGGSEYEENLPYKVTETALKSNNLITDDVSVLDEALKSISKVISLRDKQKTLSFRVFINLKQEKRKEMYSRFNKKLEVK